MFDAMIAKGTEKIKPRNVPSVAICNVDNNAFNVVDHGMPNQASAFNGQNL